MSFHVHEKNHDSEKARFLYRQFKKVTERRWIKQNPQNFKGTFRRLLWIWQRKREVNWMFSDVLVNVLSYPCLKTGKVTKGPYLPEVPTSDFGLIFLDIGNKKGPILDITTVEISDKNFRSFLQNAREPELRKGFIQPSRILRYQGQGYISYTVKCASHCIGEWPWKVNWEKLYMQERCLLAFLHTRKVSRRSVVHYKCERL